MGLMDSAWEEVQDAIKRLETEEERARNAQNAEFYATVQEHYAQLKREQYRTTVAHAGMVTRRQAKQMEREELRKVIRDREAVREGKRRQADTEQRTRELQALKDAEGEDREWDEKIDASSWAVQRAWDEQEIARAALERCERGAQPYGGSMDRHVDKSIRDANGAS